MPMLLRAVPLVLALGCWATACDAGGPSPEPFRNVNPRPLPTDPPLTGVKTLSAGPAEAGLSGVTEPVLATVSCDFATSGSFGGHPIAEALSAMASGKVLNIIPSRKSGRTVKITLMIEPDWRVFYKPWHHVHLFTRPQGEVGAYRLNRLLGMNHVPPAVMRTFNGSVIHSAFKRHALPERLEQLEREVLRESTDEMTGAMLLWVDDAVNYDPPPSLLDKMSRPRARLSPKEQVLVWDLSWMFVLDHLTNNYDRFTGGNILRKKDGRLVFIDNGAAFGPDREWKSAQRKRRLRRLTRHSPAFTRALLRVEPRVIAACVGDVLSQRDIDEVLSRRDELVSHFSELEKSCPMDCRFARELEAP
ncbi:MAG: hypothetical protein CVU59_02060 [Deltaproteobacteria bacterium HGW-Deltaproteobacteria-17]|nr:MAG: hypothetical protein CVU59_02060 [Deltaproteobacteria bacterium HGW-Deltaproteobacteria-17]